MKIKRPSNLLYLDLQIPFFKIYTTIMRYSNYEDVYEYITFHIKIWKWSFQIAYGLPEKIRKILKEEQILKDAKEKIKTVGNLRKKDE